jgi:hypothetical protein
MPIKRSWDPIAATRLAEIARQLLTASTLCTIATVCEGRPHVNVAYFSWNQTWDLVWLSDPGAQHSQNLRSTRSTAIAVFDSNQVWGQPDRGIQLFGRATRRF